MTQELTVKMDDSGRKSQQMKGSGDKFILDRWKQEQKGIKEEKGQNEVLSSKSK